MARFLHCVKWDADVETLQALDLMWQWEPMDVEDALELLGESERNSRKDCSSSCPNSVFISLISIQKISSEELTEMKSSSQDPDSSTKRCGDTQ